MSDRLTIEMLRNIIESPLAELEAEITDIAKQLINTMQREEKLREALAMLVEAKNMKDANGKTQDYLGLKNRAWQFAREVLQSCEYRVTM